LLWLELFLISWAVQGKENRSWTRFENYDCSWKCLVIVHWKMQPQAWATTHCCVVDLVIFPLVVGSREWKLGLICTSHMSDICLALVIGWTKM
jgi:hypothetical protein